MIQTMEHNGRELDGISQDVVMYLKDSSGTPHTVPEMTRALGVQKRQYIHYRITNKLQPAGLVQVESTKENAGSAPDSPRYALTDEGKRFVFDNLEQMELPTTLDEVVEVAHEAETEAESAKSSVQSYRTKVHRVRETQEELEERLESIREQDTVTERDLLAAMDANKAQLQHDIEQQTGELDDRLEELADRVETLRDDVRDAYAQAAANEEDLDEASRAHNSMASSLRDLQDDVAALEEALAEQEANSSGLF